MPFGTHIVDILGNDVEIRVDNSGYFSGELFGHDVCLSTMRETINALTEIARKYKVTHSEGVVIQHGPHSPLSRIIVRARNLRDKKQLLITHVANNEKDQISGNATVIGYNTNITDEQIRNANRLLEESQGARKAFEQYVDSIRNKRPEIAGQSYRPGYWELFHVISDAELRIKNAQPKEKTPAA